MTSTRVCLCSVFEATIPLQVPAPLEPLVALAAAFPLIGSLVCHYMVILEVLEPTQSAAKGTERDRERDVAAGSKLVLCDFEPFQKTSPSVALALLTGGHII